MEWEVLFFFVKVRELGEWAEGMRWRESVKKRDHIPAAREYGRGSVGRISSLTMNVQELQEPLLYATTLSPMSLERAGPLMYGGKRRWLCKNVNVFISKK